MAVFTADFPKAIFKAYAERRLTRAGFERAFSEWQKERGLNYDCKGTAAPGGFGLTYRGQKAAIKGGHVVWARGEWRDPRDGKGGFLVYSADSVFEFRRRVDFALLEENLREGGSKCRVS